MAASTLDDRVAIVSGDLTLTYAELDAAARRVAGKLVEEGSEGLVYCGTNDASFPIALFGAVVRRRAVHPAELPPRRRAAGPAGAGQRRLDDRGRGRQGRRRRPVGHRRPPPAGRPVVRRVRRASSCRRSSTPTTSPSSSTRRAPRARRRPRCCATGTSPPTSSARSSSPAPTPTTPRWSACRRTTSPAWPTCCRTSTPAAASSTSTPSTPRSGSTPCAARASPTPWSCPRCSPASSPHLDGAQAEVPTLRTLSYGGARMPLPVLERALELFPDTDFVNAYGLTETALHHRRARPRRPPRRLRRRPRGQGPPRLGRQGPARASRSRSATSSTSPLAVGEVGLVFLRGEQVSGEYAPGSVVDDRGLVPHPRPRLDRRRGLPLHRGPRRRHHHPRRREHRPGRDRGRPRRATTVVADSVVVGIPDDEWGQRIAAVVVLDGGRQPHRRASSRTTAGCTCGGSKTPEIVAFRAELPRTPTGKLLRREVVADLTA